MVYPVHDAITPTHIYYFQINTNSIAKKTRLSELEYRNCEQKYLNPPQWQWQQKQLYSKYENYIEDCIRVGKERLNVHSRQVTGFKLCFEKLQSEIGLKFIFGFVDLKIRSEFCVFVHANIKHYIKCIRTFVHIHAQNINRIYSKK